MEDNLDIILPWLKNISGILTSVSEWGFGVIVAILYIANSLGGVIAGKILSMFKTKKSYVSILTTMNLICFVLLGIMGKLNTRTSIIIIVVILAIQAMAKTAYSIAMKTCLQKQAENAVKIINLLCSGEHIGKAVILAFASGVVDITNTAICYIVLGIVLLLPCICVNKILNTGE